MSQKSVDDKDNLLSFIQLPFLPLGDAADACYKEQETKEQDAKGKENKEGKVSNHSLSLSLSLTTTPALPPRPYYRRNVACHFINEHEQVLACLRTDGRSWGTVQGGVEDDDDVDANNNDTKATSSRHLDGTDTDDIDASAMMIPTRGRPHDPTLLKAALREIEEEIGLSIGTLQRLGCEYVCTVNPPTAAELEALLIRRLRWEREVGAQAGRKAKGNSNMKGNVDGANAAASLTSFQFDAQANRIEWNADQIESLSRLDADPSRFFTYEFGALGSTTSCSERRRRFLGQSQTQMVFFLPSRAISHVRLVPPPPPPQPETPSSQEPSSSPVATSSAAKTGEEDTAAVAPVTTAVGCGKDVQGDDDLSQTTKKEKKKEVKKEKKKKEAKAPSQEFIAVAWMLPHQFVPLCIPFKQRIMAFALMHAADDNSAVVADVDRSRQTVWEAVRPYLLSSSSSSCCDGEAGGSNALPQPKL